MLAEVKCPYSLRSMNAKDAAKERGCQKRSGGELKMDETCKYYPLIQGQIGICGVKQYDPRNFTTASSSTHETQHE